MLAVSDISIAYDQRPVLRHLSLALEDGEIVALIGPNGAGKSTLIKALNGTITAVSGEITLRGRSISKMSRREIAQEISVVAQENETRFPITVLEYVLAGRFVNGGTFGWETQDDVEAARRSLKDCDLSGYETRLMNSLSGGERQRVVLARAIATNARILLLDEPTANLDLAHQAMMFRLVRERCNGCGASAVVITHDLNLAAEFADKIIMLKDGEIAAFGTPDEVLTSRDIKNVFGVDVLLDQNPASRKVRVTPVHQEYGPQMNMEEHR